MSSQKTIPKQISSCPKHRKSRTGKDYTHTPSIKCHEEVMSRLSSCTNEECGGDVDDCIEQTCVHRKAKFKRENVKTVSSKNKLNIHQTVSAPGSKLSGLGHKNLYPKTVKSKSIPIVQSPNFNDSVDYVPVKLTSVNDRKQRPQKRVRHILESRHKSGFKERASKPLRPTWDEILRNNLEVVSKGEIKPQKKSLQPNKLTNCRYSEHASGSSLKKPETHSLKETNNCPRQDEMKNDVLKPISESSRSTESSELGKLTIFQQINSSDPIKTLDFLIKQLRDGLLKEPQNDCLQNIILDMENAMLKISVENKTHKSHQLNGEINDKEEPANIDIQSASSSNTHEKIKNKHVDILELEHNLEKSCRFLQSLCIKQKESCSNHLREKEQLSLQLAESRRLLAVSKSREKNYEVTIGELRLKLQESNTTIDQLNKSLQDVQNKNATLKEENQATRSLKDTLKRVGVRLKQISSEKERLQSKLSIKDLEIEKLKVMLQMKTGQKNDVELQKQEDELLGGNEMDLKLSEKDLSIISLSSLSSWSGRPGLICSSQASSSPRHSPTPYNSWQHISSIVQEPSVAAEINRGIAVNLEDINRKFQQLEPMSLNLQIPSSCSSLRSCNDKVVYSDGESGSFSS